MSTETTIPILPCRSIGETLDFYRALGFEVTHEQTRPYGYGSVCWGGIHLHFFERPGFDPAQSYGLCYVAVSDVDRLFEAFTTSLKKTLGKLPSTGIPRITAARTLASGERRFNILDPGGNWLHIGQQTGAPGIAKTSPHKKSPLLRTLVMATIDMNSMCDAATAAATLDAALPLAASEPAVLRVQALILRADCAVALNDLALARSLLATAREIAISDAERSSIEEDLQRAAELETVLVDGPGRV